MKAVLQRVHSALCRVDDRTVGQIDSGLVVFLGVEEGDDQEDADSMIDRVLNLRIFPDESDKMNLDLLEVNGELLMIPNFTLCADVSSGRRPSFDGAAPADRAEAMFDYVVSELDDREPEMASGEFGEMMDIRVENDGPVTIILPNLT